MFQESTLFIGSNLICIIIGKSLQAYIIFQTDREINKLELDNSVNICNKATDALLKDRLNQKLNRPEATATFHKEIKVKPVTIQFTISKPLDLTLTREFDMLPCPVPAKEDYRGYK